MINGIKEYLNYIKANFKLLCGKELGCPTGKSKVLHPIQPPSVYIRELTNDHILSSLVVEALGVFQPHELLLEN